MTSRYARRRNVASLERAGRGQAELLELGPDVVVDEVGSGKRVVQGGGHLAGPGDGNVAVGERPLEARRDRRLARERARLDVTVGVDRDHGRFAGTERGQMRHVFRRPVGEPSRDPQIERFASAQRAFLGLDDHARQLRRIGRGPRKSGDDPAAERLVERPRGVDPSSSAVRNFGRGFLKDETLLGHGLKNSTPSGLAGDGDMVEFGVEAQERQLEAVLTAGLAVTGAGVAPRPGQNRLDVPLEGDPGGRVGAQSQSPAKETRPGHRRQTETYEPHSDHLSPFERRTPSTECILTASPKTSNNYSTGEGRDGSVAS